MLLDLGIGIKNEKIAMLGKNEYMVEAAQIIDAKGKYILPGLVDPHVHIGYPDWEWCEDCIATTKAAIAGGVTTVMDFLTEENCLKEQNFKNKETFELLSYCDGAFHAAVYTDKHIAQIMEMATDSGVSSFKFYLPFRGPNIAEKNVLDDGKIYEGFKKIANLEAPAIATVHAENIEIVNNLQNKFKKKTGQVNWNDVRPSVCEVESIRRVAFFAKETGCPIYIVHVSTKEGVEEIRKAQLEGIRIVGETCPHYLLLNIENSDRILGKIDPPIRYRDDNDALWEGIRTGVIDCVGSDHSSCALKHKNEFWSATVGFSGVQTILPVMLSEGVNKRRITIEKVAEVCSYNAAKTFGLFPQKGMIQVGADADLVLVDLSLEKTVHADDLYHISDFTPFEGLSFKGWPIATFLRGKLVAQEGRIISGGGVGKYISRFALPKKINRMYINGCGII